MCKVKTQEQEQEQAQRTRQTERVPFFDHTVGSKMRINNEELLMVIGYLTDERKCLSRECSLKPQSEANKIWQCSDIEVSWHGNIFSAA